jgi:hypothetical protein
MVRSDQIQERAQGYDPRQSSWNYLEPWMGGEWRLRDIIDYQMIAMESILYQAAARREDLLRNFYRIGRRAVSRKSPWAFVIPAEQRDPGAIRKLIATLQFGQVEVQESAKPFEAAGRNYRAGTYVIRMQQPYGAFAKTLLERQQYPDLRLYPGGPPKRPYDVTAHTLPLLMGVDAAAIETSPALELKPAAVIAERAASGVLPAASSDTWRTINKIWTAGGSVWRDPATGDFSAAEAPNLKLIARPRIGIYKSFVPSMDEGWTRWVLEQFGFAYSSAGNSDIVSGDLRKRFDVLIFPDQSAASIADGYRPGAMPEGFTGGLGVKGAEALKSFASGGGTLVFLNDSTAYATEKLGVGIRNAVADVSSREFYSPGSLLNVRVDSKSSLSYGLPAEMAIWNEGSPAWDVPAGSPARVVVRYPQSQILASGWLLGEKYLAGKAALIDYPVGSGRIVLFGMRPQYRGQSYLTFKVLFNALM